MFSGMVWIKEITILIFSKQEITLKRRRPGLYSRPCQRAGRYCLLDGKCYQELSFQWRIHVSAMMLHAKVYSEKLVTIVDR